MDDDTSSSSRPPTARPAHGRLAAELWAAVAHCFGRADAAAVAQALAAGATLEARPACAEQQLEVTLRAPADPRYVLAWKGVAERLWDQGWHAERWWEDVRTKRAWWRAADAPRGERER